MGSFSIPSTVKLRRTLRQITTRYGGPPPRRMLTPPYANRHSDESLRKVCQESLETGTDWPLQDVRLSNLGYLRRGICNQLSTQVTASKLPLLATREVCFPSQCRHKAYVIVSVVVRLSAPSGSNSPLVKGDRTVTLLPTRPRNERPVFSSSGG